MPAVGHETEHWSVYRRYLEFYVLESKLTEFHGKFGSFFKFLFLKSQFTHVKLFLWLI